MADYTNDSIFSDQEEVPVNYSTENDSGAVTKADTPGATDDAIDFPLMRNRRVALPSLHSGLLVVQGGNKV